MIITHITACVWILLGDWQFNVKDEGWIKDLTEKKLLDEDYWSKYACAVYWILTTFSSVGYGEIVPQTQIELGYTMFVEMLGICFFGYMVGLFRRMLISVGQSD